MNKYTYYCCFCCVSQNHCKRLYREEDLDNFQLKIDNSMIKLKSPNTNTGKLKIDNSIIIIVFAVYFCMFRKVLSNVASSSEWILDTGATYHLCPIKEWFKNFSELESGAV